MEGLWKGVDPLGLLFSWDCWHCEFDAGEEDNFASSPQWGKGCQVPHCLLGTATVRSLHFERNPWEVLANGSFLLWDLFSLILCVSLSYANLAKKLCIVLMQHPAVRVTKLWNSICCGEGKNYVLDDYKTLVSIPAQLWREMWVPCLSWAGTDVALMLLCSGQPFIQLLPSYSWLEMW